MNTILAFVFNKQNIKTESVTRSMGLNTEESQSRSQPKRSNVDRVKNRCQELE
jgi:hypothetical protein